VVLDLHEPAHALLLLLLLCPWQKERGKESDKESEMAFKELARRPW